MSVIEFIQNNHPEKRLIIGIDGLSRSGKTTYAKELETKLSALSYSVIVFHIDDHITPKGERYFTSHDEWFEYYYLQWNTSELKRDLFEQISFSDILALPFYNSILDKQIQRIVPICKKDIIIVEGVFLQRPEWREFFDYVLYIDCPRSIRFERENEKTKKNVEKFKIRYWKAEDYYLEKMNPAKRADSIILSH